MAAFETFRPGPWRWGRGCLSVSSSSPMSFLGLPSPFFAGVLLFRKPSKTQGNCWFLKRTMVENNGESTPRSLLKFQLRGFLTGALKQIPIPCRLGRSDVFFFCPEPLGALGAFWGSMAICSWRCVPAKKLPWLADWFRDSVPRGTTSGISRGAGQSLANAGNSASTLAVTEWNPRHLARTNVGVSVGSLKGLRMPLERRSSFLTWCFCVGHNMYPANLEPSRNCVV